MVFSTSVGPLDEYVDESPYRFGTAPLCGVFKLITQGAYVHTYVFAVLEEAIKAIGGDLDLLAKGEVAQFVAGVRIFLATKSSRATNRAGECFCLHCRKSYFPYFRKIYFRIVKSSVFSAYVAEKC